MRKRSGTTAFAHNVAGTWFLTFGPFRGLMNTHADGTFIASDTSDFGGLTGRPESPIYGIWQQTGPREMLVRFLAFAFDRDNVHLITTRVTGVKTFDESFQTWSAINATAEFFAPEQDPTDPNEAPFATHTMPLIAARRLNLPGGPLRSPRISI